MRRHVGARVLGVWTDSAAWNSEAIMDEIQGGSTSGRTLSIWLTATAGAIIAAIVVGLAYCHLNAGEPITSTDEHGRVHVHRNEPFNYTGEDGLVEWGTVVSFVGCTILAGGLAWRARGLSRRQRICLTVFAVLCFAAVGEELSWGERIFGFAPPQAMTGRDHAVRFGHKDVTIHNLAFQIGSFKFSIGGVLFALPLLLGSLFHGVALPAALRAGKPWARQFVDKLGLFVPSIALGSVMFLGVVIFYFKRVWPHSEANECKEFYIPTAYFLILLEWWRVGRRGALAPAGASGPVKTSDRPPIG